MLLLKSALLYVCGVGSPLHGIADAMLTLHLVGMMPESAFVRQFNWPKSHYDGVSATEIARCIVTKRPQMEELKRWPE